MTAIPLVAKLPVIAARGGEELVRRLFEPLGYEVEMLACRWTNNFPNGATRPMCLLEISGKRLQNLSRIFTC